MAQKTRTYRVRQYWRGNPSQPVEIRYLQATSPDQAVALSRLEDTNHFATADTRCGSRESERAMEQEADRMSLRDEEEALRAYFADE